ncbi:ATP-binding protein [Candidatus Woesearchaeota archaeon]|nr:ATP-binding protein [Candidatus Woesearchaeota archaeon]
MKGKKFNLILPKVLEEREKYTLGQNDSIMEDLYRRFGRTYIDGEMTNTPPTDPEQWKRKDNIKPTPQEQEQFSRAEMLAPLDEVFLDDKLKDDIVTRTSIPDLLEGTEPGYSGVILFGPPGTGKTVLLRAIEEVYRRAGAYAREVSTAQINTMWVGQFAKNLEEEITKAIREGERRGKPSFLYFDEGSILAQAASEGAASVSKHYQEAIDVLKRYVGNNRHIVLGISTNLLPESFEEALTREGRLTAYFIPFPSQEQRKRMWKHFAKKYEIMKLKDKQAEALGKAIPMEQGAFIEEFCRNYLSLRRALVLKEKGFPSLVEALKQGTRVKDKEVKATITFDTLHADLATALEAKYTRTNGEAEKKRAPGFIEGK